MSEMKNELIMVNFESEKPTVNGRELHAALEVETPYTKWFARMCEYGFEEGKSHRTILSDGNGFGNAATRTDHELTISMAKEICMLQRSEQGKKFREYFIAIEEAWNTPEKIIERALKIATHRANEAEKRVFALETAVAVQGQQLLEMKPKADYYDLVLRSKEAVTITVIAKDYGKTAVWLNGFLRELRVQYKMGNTWVLHQKYAGMGYTKTKTHVFMYKNGQEDTNIHTYWTQKGRLFLYGLLKVNGLLPLIEQNHAQ